ncbi:F0F1 ATP synthase subunit epsilon [Vibrio sp. CAU 1672]|uniref:F0F1 ATP synthase subunit epsilon n=1 Tax=Vibrio sp. CAU 1672 TaxID=3032594 RepID=UPI0023DB9B67|nr:F0F1 ATP synthase subunit epsilon [Vibrio sp. CAU 1672]MDF2155770.1 F0F1 ATP synthase subunit epsilon [Vibrio sp. CAU 1672]
MKSFMLRLLDATRAEEFADVTSFVGEDESGSFGLLAGHTRFMTVLSAGIAKYRIQDGGWKYLAAPGGVLYFHRNTLTLSTYRYLQDDDYLSISQALEQQLLSEKQKLTSLKDSLHHMEEEVYKRLWEIGKRETV